MLVMFRVRFFYVKISAPLSLLSEIIMGQRSPCIVQIVIDIGILSFSKVCNERMDVIKSEIGNLKSEIPSILPLHQRGAPGKASAESGQHYQVTFVYFVLEVPQAKRNGGSSCITIALNIEHYFFRA